MATSKLYVKGVALKKKPVNINIYPTNKSVQKLIYIKININNGTGLVCIRKEY